jgi:tRNA-Thr(GGU) m(6)t(6)A37 methyltransferase TsaA
LTGLLGGVMQYTIYPVGIVHRRNDDNWIEIFAPYKDAMLGLEGFSHITVLYWFHESDTPEKRSILQVHPRKDPANPLTGVFGTHSPVRPNLIGITRCQILSIEKNIIRIDAIDALDGSPVIDIKCFIPDKEPLDEIRLPAWAAERTIDAATL